MKDMMLDWLSALLLGFGSVFMVLSAVGVVRMPDVFSRMTAAAKAATLGIITMFLATAVYFKDVASVGTSLAIIAFAVLTVPTAAHALGFASYRSRIPLWERTRLPDVNQARQAPKGP